MLTECLKIEKNKLAYQILKSMFAFGLSINLKNIEFEDCPYIFYYDK
jgi:hypothetical protein